MDRREVHVVVVAVVLAVAVTGVVTTDFNIEIVNGADNALVAVPQICVI